MLASASASLSADPQALARVGLPLGGGRVTSVVAVTGPHSSRLPVQLRGGRIWPATRVPQGQTVTIEVQVMRPGWVSWLAGAAEHLRLSVSTPSTRPTQGYVTLAPRAPLTVSFTRPVSVVLYGPSPGSLTRRLVNPASTEVTLPRGTAAGSLWVAAMPRPWETARPRSLSSRRDASSSREGSPALEVITATMPASRRRCRS